MRLFKLFKAAKLKDSNTGLKSMNSTIAMERITIFGLVFLLIVHTSACIWIFMYNEMSSAALMNDDLTY